MQPEVSKGTRIIILTSSSVFRSVCIVPCGGEVVSTFVWREAVYSISDGIPEIWDRSRRGGAQQRLEFGECVLNRIEVGRIWREVKEPCAGLFDRLAYAADAMGW